MARDDIRGNDGKAGMQQQRSIDYATASPADREKMDKLIAAIDNNPENRDLIREFGKKPMEEIGKAAEKAIQAQQQYAEAFTIYSGPMKALQKGTKEIEGFIRESLGALKAVGTATGKGAGKGLRWVSKLMNSMTSGKEKTDEEKEVEKIEDGLRQQISIVTKMFNDLEDSVPALKRVDADVKLMGKALGKTNMELGFHIGAAKEMLRRYDEEILPAAFDNMETSANQLAAEQYHDAVSTNRKALLKRVAELQEAQITGKNSGMRLRNTVENISDQLDDMDFLLSIGRANIKQFVSEAGFTATTLKAAMLQQGIRNAAEDILDSQIAVLTKVNEILDRTAKRGGLISHEKLIESTNRTHQMLEESTAAKREHRQLMEAQSKEMDGLINEQDGFVRRQRQAQLEEHTAAREKAEKPALRDATAKDDFDGAARKAPTVEVPAAANQNTKPADIDVDDTARTAADEMRARRRRASGGPTND